MVPAGETVARPSAWLANPALDLAIAFGWLPFYLWLLTTPVVGDMAAPEFAPALTVAVVIALSVTFVHRHLVYFLFFGDEQQRERHPQALWLAPLIITVLVVTGRVWRPGGWNLVAITLGAWNIWHTLSQRHGIARAYAAKSGGGLDGPLHGRRDLYLLWSLAAWTAVAVVVLRPDSFHGRKAAGVLATIGFVRESPEIGWAILIAATALVLAVGWVWLAAEFRATPRGGRGPRCLLWASSVCLLAIFVQHGLIVGYLVFGFAHASEYIFFVYLFSRRRIERGEQAVGVRLLGGAVPMVLVSATLLVLFVAARQVWSLPLFAAYYSVTSALHFFYDGLIWKMRRPEVRAPLVG